MRNGILFLAMAAGLLHGQSPAPHPAFDKDAVHEIKLTFPNADWYEVLAANYDGVRADNPYFAASFEWGEYRFDNVGVRFKGNSSYNVNGRKKPFRIKLNEFVKGQKIESMASFSLSNGWNDPSMVREPAYYQIARAMGLKASRANYAALYINGEYWGLYVLTEVVNSDFLKTQFGKNEDTGNMYKGNIGASFAYLGEDPAPYKSAWEKQSNEELDDWSDLIALCKLINDTPAEELRAKIEAVMDIDSVLAALALDNATVNLDSYVGMGQNFYIYRRPSDSRWVWIPWDPSLAFGALSQGVSGAAMLDLALEWTNTNSTGGAGGIGGFPGGGPPAGGVPPTGGVPPAPGAGPGGVLPNPGAGGGGIGGGAAGGGRPLATKLWAIPECKERYRLIYQQLVDKFFLAAPVLERMTAQRAMIRPWLELDTQKLSTLEQFDNAMTAAIGSTSSGPGQGGQGGQGGGGSAPGLQPFVEGRLAGIRTLLGDTAAAPVFVAADVASLALTATAGKSSEAQKVTVTGTGALTPTSYTITSTTDLGGAWLTVSPLTGMAGSQIEVSASAKNLEPGVYTGTVAMHIAAAANSPLLVPVTLTVGR
jgi:hypothetical protein